ncbi:MAG: hypothetical protein JWM68_2185 [Verrucomicrobiales bacterium]|nr:hypothetical protein [Verrucomicrobiales bacterium]
MALKSTQSKGKTSRWFAEVLAWFELKKLEREFRSSEKFQRECEKLRCFHLAKMEEGLRGRIAAEINELKK